MKDSIKLNENSSSVAMERFEVKPKCFPTNLLKIDWTQRKCFFFFETGYQFMDQVHDMVVREDDVWLVTLPKCGTTWMQELVWLVLNDYDFEAAKMEDVDIRSPFLELEYTMHRDLKTSLQHLEQAKSPRLIKTHLPLPLLPAQLWQKKPKVIYVYRNPKDFMVSAYYHFRSLGFELDKTCEEYTQHFIEEISRKLLPFEHVNEFYALRHEPWVFYTSYERMKANLREVIMDVVRFLNRSINEEQMQQMLEHLSFESMKANPKTNHSREFEQIVKSWKRENIEKHDFIRQGQVGGYKKDLSPKFVMKVDQWIEEQLKPQNLTLNQLLLLEEDKKT